MYRRVTSSGKPCRIRLAHFLPSSTTTSWSPPFAFGCSNNYWEYTSVSCFLGSVCNVSIFTNLDQVSTERGNPMVHNGTGLSWSFLLPLLDSLSAFSTVLRLPSHLPVSLLSPISCLQRPPSIHTYVVFWFHSWPFDAPTNLFHPCI